MTTMGLNTIKNPGGRESAGVETGIELIRNIAWRRDDIKRKMFVERGLAR